MSLLSPFLSAAIPAPAATVTSAEIMKNTIINEIEESLLGNKNNNLLRTKFNQGEYSRGMEYYERDFAIGGHAIRKAMEFGVDSSFSLEPKPLVSLKEFERPNDDPLLEEQLEYFFTQMESDYNISLIPAEEKNSESCWKDKTLLAKFPESPVDPFFLFLREHKPALFKALQHHSLFTGKYKPKKKLSRKYSRKERKEKERKREMPIIEEESLDEDPSVQRRNCLLGCLLTKSFVDGTLQSQLVAFAMLLHRYLLHQDNNNGSNTNNTNDHHRSLPVGNILAAIFHSEGSNVASLNENENNDFKKLNPFQFFLRSLTDDDEPDRRPGNRSTRGETGSQSTIDDRHSEIGSHYAPSNVESIQAEHGTETASIADMTEQDHNNDDDEDDDHDHDHDHDDRGNDDHDGHENVDEDEEELLAQALALSLGSENAFISSENSKPTMPSLSESALSQIPTQTNSFGNRNMSPTSQTFSENGRLNNSNLPTSFPTVHPLSTFGPFCEPEFWKSLLTHDDAATRNSLVWVSLQSVMVALLVNMGCGIDYAENPQSLVLLQNSSTHESLSQKKSIFSSMSPGSPSRSFVAALAAAAAAAGNKKSPSPENNLQNTPLPTIPLVAIPSVTPHPVTFLLIDLLFEMICKCLVSGQYKEDRSTTYFLTWCLISLLKILRTNFTVMTSLSITPSSLGLGKINEDNQKPVLSLSEKLLNHILLCIGSDVFPRESISDNSLSFDPTMQYRHSIRLLGIDTLIAGYFIFYPTRLERELSLSSLLEITPVCFSTISGLSPFTSLPNVYSTFYANQTFDNNDQSKNPEYYRSLLLQKICLQLTSSDWSISTHSDLLQSTSSNTTLSSSSAAAAAAAALEADDKDKLKLISHLRSLLPRDANEHALDRLDEMINDIPSHFESMKSVAPSNPEFPEEDKLKENLENETYSGSGGNDSVDSNSELKSSIAKILLNRLRSPHLMDDISSNPQTSPINSLFWGEFCLLLKIQQNYINEFIKTYPEEEASDLEFDLSHCSEHLNITNERRTVNQSASRTWSTVLSSTKFDPNTGEHIWAIRLQKCEKGHVFIGVAKANASVSTYVGGDENGWGLIGTRTLWHNRSKVKTSFGEGFSSRSVMYIRYNSDSGQLFYSNNSRGNWNLAFENIPKEPIYPAVSLYQKDDSVSLVTPSSNLFNPELQSIDDIPRLFSSMIPFLTFASTIFDDIEILLNNIENLSDHQEKLAALHHPFLTCLLPSITAGILYSKHPSHQSAYLSIHLLPHLTLLAKKVALLHEMYMMSPNDRTLLGFVGDVSGSWKIKSGAAGNNIPAQEYSVNFVSTLVDKLIVAKFMDSEEKTPNSIHSPLRLVGEGRGGSSSFDVEGIIYGTRIKFQETWNLGGACLVEGRLSLDGGSFVGTFKDIKTGSVGTIQGHRQIQLKVPTLNQNFLLKTALLIGTAAGKLAANLVVGMEALPSLDIFDVVPTSSPNWSRADDIDSVLTAPEDSKEDNEIPDADSKIDPNDDHATKPSADVLQRWTTSPLFSEGLRNDTNFHDALAFQLVSYFNMSPSGSQTTLLSQQSVELKNWWLQTIFINVDKYCQPQNSLSGINSTFSFLPMTVVTTDADLNANTNVNTNANSNASVITDREPTNQLDDPLFTQLQANSGMGKRLDEHLVRYSGLSALSKIGGEPMQSARRRVLTALLYQTGCLSLCYAEDKLLSIPDRDILDKPHPLLLDIWRAAQKVIEYAIRIKQTTGVSYQILSQDICKKAELLLLLHPCNISQNVAQRLSQNNLDEKLIVSINDTQLMVSKVLSDSIEFFQISVMELTHLRTALFRGTLKAYSRTAGLRSILLLLSKLPSVNKFGDLSSRIPSQSSLLVQSSIIEYLLPAFFGKVPLGNDIDFVDNSDKSEHTITFPTSSYSNDGSGYPIGHFNDSLLSVSHDLMVELRQSFEGVYELITQLIQRSTWAGDRDGQCIALSSWNIPIIPEDHTFLNRIGIFRVLQTVLDDARASIQRAQLYSPSNSKLSKNELFMYEIVNGSNRRLTQLALRIIHSLASQVAFSKTSTDSTSKTSSLNLQRYPSGPETLSQSLFDMLYSELYNCMKNIMLHVHGESDDDGDSNKYSGGGGGGGGLSNEAKNLRLGDGLDELEGEKYAYRILRLLYSVSESTVCQRYLTTPKWLTLLVASIGYGDLAVQRRLMRLLRRLLISLSPDKVRLFIHDAGLFCRCDEILLSEKALDDDDVESLISSNSSDLPSVQKLLNLFLKAAIIILPNSESINSPDYSNVLKHLYHIPSGPISLTAESIALLRLLEDIPIWKSAIVSALRAPLQCLLENNSNWEKFETLQMIAASMGVLGGHIDRLRVGGTVTLKPFSLVSSNETFALRLASVSHSSGMLVAITSSAAEVVLMERSRKVVKSTPGSRHPFNTQYGLSLSGPLPIRTVKMNLDDIMAAPDIPHPPDFFDANLLTDGLMVLAKFCLPYLKELLSTKSSTSTSSSTAANITNTTPPPVASGRFAALDDCELDDDDDQMDDGLDDELPDISIPTKEQSSTKPSSGNEQETLSELEAVKLYVTTSSFRAISEFLQFNMIELSGEDLDIESLFSSLLSYAIQPVSVGGLSEIEVIAERYAALWGAYVMSGQSIQVPEPISHREEDPDEAAKSFKSKLRVSRAQIEDPNSSGSSRGISANMLAAMMSGPSAAEASHARDTMMEMGFPREWCEFALRKCRYNVELAINLCFEHGSEMTQLIAEDAALASAANSARSGSSRFSRQSGMEGMAARLAGARRSEISSRQQLMGMGFPPNWCTRALETNHNDVDAALSWILSHGEELIASDDNKDATTETKTDAATSSTSTSSKKLSPDFGPNPISCVSGTTTISPDLSCGLGSTSGFPSVGCRGYHVNSGKWYYEILLMSAGCMQFGWVDLAYEGNAEQGQGVGDDVHSWAFDGWRRFKWHDLSTSWGAKWSVGDVLGIAVDMDNLTMTFTLNGYAEEIGMGVAFSNFTYHGGIYPCASFNRNEKFQFNFGYTPFKYLPLGYRGYIEHIQKCLSANTLRLQGMLLFKSSLDAPQTLEKSIEPNFFEECIEEQRGESDFLSHRRYFLPDDSLRVKQIERNSHNVAAKIASSPIPSETGLILKQFSQLAGELCILYARLIILRLFTATSRTNTPDNHTLVAKILFSSNNNTNTNNTNKMKENLTNLFYIIRESSLTTLRTRTYLQTLSILPASNLPPSNLGSVLMTGGASMLFSIQIGISELITNLKKNSSYIIEYLLDLINTETLLSTKREYSAEWRVEGGGIVPVIYSDATTIDLKDKNIPLLPFAWWLSIILIEKILNELIILKSINSVDYTLIMSWIYKLIHSWTQTLNSPVIAVKLCGIRLLSNVIQEFYFGECACSQLCHELDSLIPQIIPLERIEKLVLLRMEQEKSVQPICSEYLQNLIDFAITIRSVVNYSNENKLFPDQSLSNYPPSSSEVNNNVEEFNWDSIYGSLMSDDGWEVWSGTVRQLEGDFLKAPISYRPLKPDQIPPPLLPGARVIRIDRPQLNKVSSSSNSSSTSSNSVKEITTGLETARNTLYNLLNDRGLTTNNTDTTTTAGGGGGAGGGATTDTSNDIGTVVEIINYNNNGPGSGRIIRWSDDTIEKIRWGADGIYEVIHVTLDSSGKIQTKHPPPLSEDKRAAKSGFGSDVSFGILLRLRSLPIQDNDEINDITGRFDGLMEWPDFNAVVYVTGTIFSDGHWSFTEQKLVAGAEHSDWTIRFGQPHWQSGTTYELSLPRYVESEENVNGLGRYLLGQFQYQVTCFSNSKISIIGDIKIQQSKLFTFDTECHATSISISHDQLAAACTGGEGKCCAYASIGFNSGVHYWEFKIEQCELGNIFIGVAEKPSREQGPSNFKKWQGYGFVNLRLSFRNTSSSLSGEKVYGDLFQTGDTVGVLLDMNRGRLSFFLDAMKYGEHMLIDLGEAFDGLTTGSSHKVLPKTYYPIVGFKRAGDRVTISPRWVSSTGHYNMYQEFKNISRAWNLLSSWSEERASTTPQAKDLWIYREAWRDWLRWKSNRFMKVRTRCRALNLLVGLDISPRACVDASIRLGLSTAFYHGDRIVFIKSCGRNLETHEEAVILGSFRGQLWYRLDSQNNTGALVEGSNLAWCLAVHDVEDIQFIKRGNIRNILPAELIDIELCRLPVFRGGLLRVIYESGAVMREGLEIDYSDHTGTVEHDAIVYALERRVNSSNIARYRVYYNGTFGWISERIRGGNEEFMAQRITEELPNQLTDSLNAVRAAVKAGNYPYRVDWKEVSTPLEALREWESTIRQKGYQHLLNSGEILAELYHQGVNESFEKYLSLSTTYDGTTNWPVEYDMLLTEYISRVSLKLGQSPFNLPSQQIIESIKLLDENSPLLQISFERLIARCSIIRMANVVIGYSLPYIELTLPEERWQADIFGLSCSNIEIIQNMNLLKKKDHLLSQIDNDMNWLGDNYNQLVLENRQVWQPPCVSRRLRTKRRVLFTQTKHILWENILDATTTPTPLHQDEYEDPREIKLIRINRIKATQGKLTTITSANERLTHSVFGQLHKEMRSWPSSSFRRAYVGKGHGGQKRAFKVKFLGEGVNDYGGPYRAVFEQIADEAQCDSVVGQKTSDRCLLPLLGPCPNRTSGVGSNQDKFLLNSSPTSPLNQELMQFFGKLTGTALRHNMNLGLDLSCLFWRPLVRVPISRSHLETIDLLTAKSLTAMEKLGQEYENNSDAGYDKTYIPKEWTDLTFTVTTADGTKTNLIPGGEDLQVNLGNWREYILLVERYRLRDTSVLFRSYREGLSSVIPVELFPIFTPNEMEEMFSGCRAVDIKLLKQCTEYDGIDPNSQLVTNFWSVLEEMTDEERTLFLRFVWARSRMPASTQDLIMNFKLQAVNGEAQSNPDQYLPHAQTCFFSLGLPPYTTKEILREKLLYAIHNSPNMDADVRLHNAEGWTEA